MKKIEKTTQNCPVCLNEDTEICADYRGLHRIFVGLKRSHCISCGMYFASPMPSEAEQIEYNASYFDSAHGGQKQDPVTSAFYSGLSKLRGDYVTKYIKSNSMKINSVLEIGPGPGFFANNWLENNPGNDYYAIETDQTCFESLKMIGVRLIDHNQYKHFDKNIDLIVMSHVLEHVSEPREFLLHVTHALRRGGALFIEVPCRDWDHKSLDEPHLLFFDKAPMEYLLESIGFENIQINYYGQKISDLKRKSYIRSKMNSVRSRLISLGFAKLFGRKRNGMECVNNSLERAAVAPFMAHIESPVPTWWLRLAATKK